MLSKYADYKPKLQNHRRRQEPQFEVLVDQWWPEKSKTLALGTLKAYVPCIARAVDVFGAYRMNEITPAHIQGLLKDMRGAGFSQKTIDNQHAVLNMIFDYYVSEYGGTTNVSRLIKSPKTKSGQKKRTRPTETQRALLAANVTDHDGGLFCGFLLYTSCRKGEVLALQYKDIDLAHLTISITKNITYTGNAPIVTKTKTENSVRTNPIVEVFYPYLARAVDGKHKPTDFIFGGKEPMTESRFEKMWLDFLEPLGLIGWTDGSAWKGNRKNQRHALVTPHQLRHEFAYSLYKADVDELQAKTLMGHADIATTHNIYTELGKEDIERSAVKLNAYFTEKDAPNQLVRVETDPCKNVAR